MLRYSFSFHDDFPRKIREEKDGGTWSDVLFVKISSFKLVQLIVCFVIYRYYDLSNGKFKLTILEAYLSKYFRIFALTKQVVFWSFEVVDFGVLLSRHSFLTALIQQDKSSSSVKLPNLEKKSSPVGDGDRERFHARNWKALSKKEIQKLPPQQRSKYLAVRYRCFRFAC